MWFILKSRKKKKNFAKVVKKLCNNTYCIIKYKVLYKFASEGNLYCFKDVEIFFTGQKKVKKIIFAVSCTVNGAFHSMSDVGYFNLIYPIKPFHYSILRR